MILTGKLSTKGQLTIPKELREQLGFDTGMELMFSVEGSGLKVEKVRPFDSAWHRFAQTAMADEWNSPEDEEAYRDLQFI